MAQSRWSLALDLLSARLLVWVARWGRDAELTPEAHAYFYDRYSRLAAYYRAHGHHTKATRLEAKAEEHYTPDNSGPPYAAAMALPRPTRFVRTVVVGGGPDGDDAA
jgi:hypothetical protein